MRIYLLIAAIAGGVTWLVTPLIRHVAIEIGAVGEVRARDVHTIPTPRMGGLGMLIGFAVATVFASRLPFLSGLFNGNYQMWVILAGGIMISLLGMADDLWDLDWMLKLAGQLLISVFVAWGGLQIISLPLGGSLITASPSLSMAITAFLIVASINAVNFVDGLDGLAAGIVAIGGIAFAAYSYIIARSSPSYASLATLIDVMMVGICVGFLLHNWHPAKLFMGDSGSMLLGYLITCASIVMTGRLDPASIHASIYLPGFMPILLPSLGVFLPVLDMGLAIVVWLLTGVILGWINGTLIAYAKLPAMIVTIGTMNLFRGLAQIFIGDASLGSFPDWFNAVDKMAVFETEDANFSVTLLLFIILAIIAYLLLHKMSIGRKVFAIGTNEQAAIWSGIKTKKIKLGLFIASGIIAAVGGLLTMSRLGLVRYDMNLNKEVDVIIMVLLGGADINGGSGSIVGTFLAVLLVIILKTGLIVANVTADAQMFVMGLILLISIIIPNVGQVLKERKDK